MANIYATDPEWAPGKATTPSDVAKCPPPPGPVLPVLRGNWEMATAARMRLAALDSMISSVCTEDREPEPEICLRVLAERINQELHRILDLIERIESGLKG
ncbi:hypothetical protein [Methylobacterium marchantiae]|uniref:Uncharacterized protein n=1 Tax=Methylobacterium marchantiae TaxID=600331 RepID=A0ABW3X5G7_9HYPH|nr:hypothetical protein AIGOOFII_3492 [Methylobacterium marchantiae]